ncbi:hypothetical protein SASPL_102502 [Salvia splendens]|uniref:Phytocyanin domain-containing protein n=1 Tax=Salvia splendens TaxID=180675 RepID=A0A8X8YXK7_SALSN|nr:hypothetical protein SASPL_102502 [Salvia splendens]
MTISVALTIKGTLYYFSDANDGEQCQQGMAFEIKVGHGLGLPPSLNQPLPPAYVPPPGPANDEEQSPPAGFANTTPSSNHTIITGASFSVSVLLVKYLSLAYEFSWIKTLRRQGNYVVNDKYHELTKEEQLSGLEEEEKRMLEERHILKEEGTLESMAGAVDETVSGRWSWGVASELLAQSCEISWGRPLRPTPVETRRAEPPCRSSPSNKMEVRNI